MFLLEYIKSPKKVGAVAPSSKYLAYEMINEIDFENTRCIIEYGPGTGAFTFNDVKYKKVMRNVPPAYVLRCRGGKNGAKNISCR